MGGAASTDIAQRPRTVRVFCRSCRRFSSSIGPTDNDLFQTCGWCHSTFIVVVEDFHTMMQEALDSEQALTTEQAQQFVNAAVMIQLLELQLREELALLPRATQDTNSVSVGANSDEPILNSPLTENEWDNMWHVPLTIDLARIQPSCPICRDDHTVGERLLQLPCLHIYHMSCVMPWLTAKRTCPICRYNVTSELCSVDIFEKRSEASLLEKIALCREDAYEDVPTIEALQGRNS